MKVKTNLNKLNVAGKVGLARTVVTKMTGNSNFTTPSPTLAAITTAATDLENAASAALAARATSKQATSTQADKEKVLSDLLLQEAAYVQNTTAGDKTKIESSGFSVNNPSAPIGALPAPVELAIDSNTNPGTLALKWKSLRGADSYSVQRAPDSDGSLAWISQENVTKPKALSEGMTSGSRYWFRVAGVGAAGTGLWTDPISKIAP